MIDSSDARYYWWDITLNAYHTKAVIKRRPPSSQTNLSKKLCVHFFEICVMTKEHLHKRGLDKHLMPKALVESTRRLARRCLKNRFSSEKLVKFMKEHTFQTDRVVPFPDNFSSMSAREFEVYLQCAFGHFSCNELTCGFHQWFS
jgi:hypothetical protein